MMKNKLKKFIGFPAALTKKHPALKLCVLPFLLLFAFCLLCAAQWLTLGGGPLHALNWVFEHPKPALFTVLALTALLACLWGLSGSLFAAGFLVTVPVLVLAFINFYKLKINGAPLEIADFVLAKNLSELATLSKGNLTLPLRGIAVVCGCVLLLLIALWLDRGLRPGRRPRLTVGVLCLALLCGLACAPGLQRTALKSFSMQPASRIGQTYSNAVNGLLGGLFRAWCLRNGTAPEDYSEAYMQEILTELGASAQPGGDGELPSVILVLSESFFDVTTLPNVAFSADPLPVFHGLEEQTLSGTFYTSYCGYGTGIIERSVLAGLHSRYLPYGTNICYMTPEDTGRFTALPEAFRAAGYRTLAMHTYNNELYNRTEAFPVLGFDRVLFEDDFYDESRLKGGYLSDDYFADLIISNYEEMTAEGNPAFIFGISMENHQPYPGDKFEETEFSASSALLSESELASLATVAQGIHDADASLGKLMEYFSGREEKVILVFFGDHRPSLPTADGQTIYQKLGACTNGDDFYWTPEERAVLYATEYLAWANYDAFDGADFGENVRSGDMMLGSDILDWAGIRKPMFWQAVEQLSQQVCSYTEYGFVAADGTPSAKPTAAAAGVISRFEAILYDAFFGERYITEALNGYGD